MSAAGESCRKAANSIVPCLAGPTVNGGAIFMFGIRPGLDLLLLLEHRLSSVVFVRQFIPDACHFQKVQAALNTETAKAEKC